MGITLASCATCDSRKHDELVGSLVEVAFTQFGIKTSHDETMSMREARRLYTAVPQRIPSKNAESDKRLTRVINWNSRDRFVRVLCMNDHGKWIIFDVLDVPSDKGF